jgi:hypothetical protein
MDGWRGNIDRKGLSMLIVAPDAVETRAANYCSSWDGSVERSSYPGEEARVVLL